MVSSVALHCVTAAFGARVFIIMCLAEVPESGLFVAEVAETLETLPTVMFKFVQEQTAKTASQSGVQDRNGFPGKQGC